MNFDDAFDKLIAHEGGYVNDRRDLGGETKFGISKVAYPMEDIANLTLERARTIYRVDYWGAAGCDGVPDCAKLQLFDMAVNSGVHTAIRTVQRAVGTAPDGVMGPNTLQAVQSMAPARFVARFNGQRLAFLSDLSTWPAFGRGWARRVADNLMET